MRLCVYSLSKGGRLVNSMLDEWLAGHRLHGLGVASRQVLREASRLRPWMPGGAGCEAQARDEPAASWPRLGTSLLPPG